MISAIAARKAAQAKLPASPLPQPASESNDSKSPSPVPPKRKRVSDAAIPHPKKKKKSSNKPPSAMKTTRYFQESDPITRQGDIILIESDQEDEDEDGMGALASAPVGTRAWSPSGPVIDDSEEGGSGSRQELQSGPKILSSYSPVLNQNLFPLEQDEIVALGLLSSSGCKAVLVVLGEDETIALLGTCTLTVIRGSVSLLGATLEPCQPRQHHRIFAPRSSPIPVLKASSGKPSEVSEVSRLNHAFRDENVLVVLQELRTNVEGLGKICKTFQGVFQLPHSLSSPSTPDLGLHGVHLVMNESKGIHAFVQPSPWDSAFVLCESEQVFLVKGTKKSGKSTFARTLLNHLLGSHRRVAYLECDLGQSEFTPGGMVALNVIEKPVFGPPFTHPTIPIHAHYLGSFTPRSSPSHYISAIQSLAQTYQLDVRTPYDDPDERIPLVVNIMGWSKGLGADLTKRIEEIIEPDRVFEFEVEGRGNDGGWYPQKQRQDPSIPKHHLHILRPIESQAIDTATAYYSAADHRLMSLLSYFHAVFPSSPSPPSPSSSLALLLKDSLRQITAQTWATSLPLLAQPPYEVDVEKAIETIYLIGAGSEDVVKEEINRVLNGAIVGLISSEINASTSSQGESGPGNIPYVQNTPPPDPNTSRAHGLALIRGVSSEAGDTSGTRLHVLTPLPPDLLSTTKVLVKGEMEMPVWGLLDLRGGPPEETAKPFLQWGKGEGVGSEKRRVRRNLMRKSQA
ncbi:Polynucleotide 5'-hydroxyl-kinase grc3 [Marasmius sp. AFHP31]|nr:Polynucleotide 5'-hydroxyl-kinase grc3 [Marasmius sp. AFHP31]